MAYIAFSACFACGKPFGYNPDLVPSIRVNENNQPDPNGVRKPVCEDCMRLTNIRRERMGLQPHVILPGAYEATEDCNG